LSRTRLAVVLVTGVALALGLIGPASARSQAAARYGGVLVVGLANGDPDSLDPTVSHGISPNVIYGAMCETLYTYDARYRLVPVLAAAAPALSKDKLSYTVQVRQGIQFNDGTPFNAQAVVDTVERMMTYPESSRATDFAAVDTVDATGPYTVVFHLKVRDSSFTPNPIVLSPTQVAKTGANFGASPVCVGPFMFDHRVVGDNVTLIKSPYYYDQKYVYLDKIVFKPTPDPAAAAAALEAGDIQALSRVAATELPGLRSSGFRVIQRQQLGWSGIVINIGDRNGAGNPPYTNVGTPLASSAKLRQAFEEAIDRPTLTKVVFDGLFAPSCTIIPASNTAWYDGTKVPCTPYDPKDAQHLVATSGFPHPTVHLLTPNATDMIGLAQFIQAQEAAVGIDVMIDPTDPTTATARATAGNFDTWVQNLVPGYPDPSDTFTRFVTWGVSNRSGYSNPRFDFVFSNAVKATDVKARSKLYRVAQQILGSDRPVIVLYNMTAVAGYSANVSGVELDSNGGLRVANAQLH
jgi:peptide/nickel transport system substrate-binding protein